MPSISPSNLSANPIALLVASVFGPDANELNFERDRSVLGQMLSFNGNENAIRKTQASDIPARCCPGYGSALSIVEFLVDRYGPQDDAEDVNSEFLISSERMSEIRSKESFLVKAALNIGSVTYSLHNKLFAHAADVSHPLDSNGKSFAGAITVNASGKREIPVYGKVYMFSMQVCIVSYSHLLIR